MANTENIRKWVEALRSGRFEQTTGYLRDSSGYCCLGVACEISGVVKAEYANDTDSYSYDGNSETLPIPVREWLGVEDADPFVFDEDGYHVALTQLNDERGHSFGYIADCIEGMWL